MRKRLLDGLVWLGIFLCCGVLACMLAYPAFAEEESDTGVSSEPQQTEQGDVGIGP